MRRRRRGWIRLQHLAWTAGRVEPFAGLLAIEVVIRSSWECIDFHPQARRLGWLHQPGARIRRSREAGLMEPTQPTWPHGYSASRTQIPTRPKIGRAPV